MIPTERLCCRCQEIKTAENFHVINRRGSQSLQSYCKPCMTIRSREWREANRERDRENSRRYNQMQRKKNPRAVRSAQLKSVYGITLDQYEEMLNRQDGRCAICRDAPGKRRLHVDHDHATGKVRSLLCTRCNTALGLLDEDAERMAVAIHYLGTDAVQIATWVFANLSIDGLRLMPQMIEYFDAA